MNTHFHNKLVLKIAVSIIVVFVFVLGFITQPNFLINWQNSKTYKEYTGYTLFVLTLIMWWMPLAPKVFDSTEYMKFSKLLHQWCGILILLLVLFHASFLKVGFLAGFTFLLLVGAVCGAAYRLIKGPRTTKIHTCLLGAHIGIAVAISCMSLLHMYFIFAYTK